MTTLSEMFENDADIFIQDFNEILKINGKEICCIYENHHVMNVEHNYFYNKNDFAGVEKMQTVFTIKTSDIDIAKIKRENLCVFRNKTYRILDIKKDNVFSEIYADLKNAH